MYDKVMLILMFLVLNESGVMLFRIVKMLWMVIFDGNMFIGLKSADRVIGRELF